MNAKYLIHKVISCNENDPFYYARTLDIKGFIFLSVGVMSFGWLYPGCTPKIGYNKKTPNLIYTKGFGRFLKLICEYVNSYYTNFFTTYTTIDHTAIFLLLGINERTVKVVRTDFLN